eukprot:1139265-Pelagomonas_calceolata.AAC.1
MPTSLFPLGTPFPHSQVPEPGASSSSAYVVFSFLIMTELLDLLLAGIDQPQADQPNSLAEGLPV